jgi:hypothetical protein
MSNFGIRFTHTEARDEPRRLRTPVDRRPSSRHAVTLERPFDCGARAGYGGMGDGSNHDQQVLWNRHLRLQ